MRNLSRLLLTGQHNKTNSNRTSSPIEYNLKGMSYYSERYEVVIRFYSFVLNTRKQPNGDVSNKNKRVDFPHIRVQVCCRWISNRQ